MECVVKGKRNKLSRFTLFTASHCGKTHDLMISLGRGLGHSEGLTSSLFCLQKITVTR